MTLIVFCYDRENVYDMINQQTRNTILNNGFVLYKIKVVYSDIP